MDLSCCCTLPPLEYFRGGRDPSTTLTAPLLGCISVPTWVAPEKQASLTRSAKLKPRKLLVEMAYRGLSASPTESQSSALPCAQDRVKLFALPNHQACRVGTSG